MGLFDLLRPVVFAADDALQFLPSLLRLLLWAAIAAFAGMWLYRLASPQERLKTLKEEVRRHRRAMMTFDGDADEMWPIIRNSLSSSLRHLGLTFFGALVAGVQVLMIISPVAQRYAYVDPAPGTEVAVMLHGAGTAQWQWRSQAFTRPAATGAEGDQVIWPGPGGTLVLEADNQPVATLPLPPGSGVIHKKLWWNALFANPAGYLEDDAPLEALDVDLPAQEFIPAGPGWVRGWLLTFFAALIAISIVIKIWWRVE
ncbi:MAG: hypothetical protein AAGA23_07125 [Pseudomonadota bacterium]